VPDLDQQTLYGYGQSPPELSGIDGPHQNALDGVGDLSREAVELPAKERLQSESSAGEGGDVVLERMDDVLGLPELAALDACPGMKDVVAAEADLVGR
jgi:hypothetical protein